MPWIGVILLVSTYVSYGFAVPARPLRSSNNSITATSSLTIPVLAAGIPSSIAGSSPANPSSVPTHSLPATYDASVLQGKPFINFIYSPDFRFHATRGPGTPGFAILSTCNRMLRDASAHSPTSVVSDPYITPPSANFHFMYIEMLDDNYPLRWQDVLAFASGIRTLLVQDNGGKTPREDWPGQGWEYWGDIFPNVARGHPDETLCVGRFYMEEDLFGTGVGRNGSASS